MTLARQTKTQIILTDLLNQPMTTIELRAKYGHVKSLLRNLRNAGCATYVKVSASECKTFPQISTHLYTATGKPYVPRNREKVIPPSPAQEREAQTRRDWNKRNRSHVQAYQRGYYLTRKKSDGDK